MIHRNVCKHCGAVREYPSNEWIEECPRCKSTDIAHIEVAPSKQQSDNDLLRAVEGEPFYFCGAAYCDDPACGTHGSLWVEWRRNQ